MALIKPLNPHRDNRIDYVNEIAALILQRRHQMLIHSYLYYHKNINTVSDKQFDAWARELAQLQRDNPEISEKVFYYRDAFRGFDGTTGCDLPYTDARIVRRAELLLDMLSKEQNNKKSSRRFKKNE